MAVIWHDLECGAYAADIPFWLGLAAEVDGPILDVGAGTGRVALALAYAGHEVHALERDPQLAAELRRRGRGLPLRAICADAQDFASDIRFELVIVPMQTLHLIERTSAFLRCARRAMPVGGRLAAALLGEGVTPFREELAADETWIGGVHYASRPSALWIEHGTVFLERRREIDGELAAFDVTSLAPVDAFLSEAPRCGFRVDDEPSRVIAATDEHAGSEVVILHAL